jgi:hypothetical protein
MTPKLLAKLSIFPKYNLRDIKEINKNKNWNLQSPGCPGSSLSGRKIKAVGLLWLDCV